MGCDRFTRTLADARAMARQPRTRILDMVERRSGVSGRVVDPAELRDAPAKLVVGLDPRLRC